jgi:hypothetical protein
VVSMAQAARMARALPEVTVGERYGRRTWFVGGKAFTWERPLCAPDDLVRAFLAKEPKRRP